MKRSIFFLLVILLASCQDEEIPTRAQVTAKKLASDLHISLDAAVTNYAITVIDLKNNTTLFTGTSLKVTSDGFVEGGNGGPSTVVYNLEFLNSYQVITGSNLWLYF